MKRRAAVGAVLGGLIAAVLYAGAVWASGWEMQRNGEGLLAYLLGLWAIGLGGVLGYSIGEYR